jgi:phage baseplate assembly protein W
MPLERISVGFRDISLSLKKNPLTRDLSILKNEQAIARSIQNLVLTIRGEKFFEPSIGTSVNKLLFENIDIFTAREIETQIIEVINQFEPRVELLEAVVTPDYDEGAMDVKITYLIVGIDALPQQLEFVLLPTR